MKRKMPLWRGAFIALFVTAAILPGYGQYREYYISGSVVDSQKAPLEGVEITLREASTNRRFSMKTKKDGLFKFAGLPHGDYKVTFSKEGFATKEDQWRFEKPQDKMQKVEMPAVVLATTEFVQESLRLKESAAEVQKAVEKVRTGDYDAAIADLQTVLAKDPKDSNALYILGMAYLKKKMWPEAVTPFLQVVELAPKFAPAYYQLGVCYQQQKEPEKALEYYQKAMDMDPSNPDSSYNAGLILFGMSRVDEALANFEKTLKLKPDDSAALEMAGRCYINRAEYDKAIAYLEKAKAAAAGDPERSKFLDDLVAKLKEQIKKPPVPSREGA